MKLKYFLATAMVAAITANGAQAQQWTDGTIKIGVLTDLSSLYADVTGIGSVIAARLAVEDYDAASKGLKVEVVSADHQNKPDVGANISRQWIDDDKVDTIVDVPTSSVILPAPNAHRIPSTGPMTPGRLPTAPGKPSSRPAGQVGSLSPPIMHSAMRSNATPLRSSTLTAAR
jgi:hypothetical protein